MSPGNSLDEVTASYHKRILKEMVAKKIAGDILFSKNIGLAMRKWREYFNIRQSELARLLGVSASVISDYESGRRKSPGSLVLKRFVEALIAEDEKRGGAVIRIIAKTSGISGLLTSVIDIREFSVPIPSEEFVEMVDGVEIVPPEPQSYVNGYTIIDSIKAIENLSGSDFMRLFGVSTERALIFTKVSMGRSPMVALRVFDIRPTLVILHGPDPNKVDFLATKLAEIMRVGLVVTRVPDVAELAERLRESI